MTVLREMCVPAPFSPHSWVILGVLGLITLLMFQKRYLHPPVKQEQQFQKISSITPPNCPHNEACYEAPGIRLLTSEGDHMGVMPRQRSAIIGQ